MAFTQADLDRVNAAIAGGETLVQFADGKRVQYRSVSELIAARNLIASEITTAEGTRPPRAFRVNVSKGVL